MKRQLWHDYLLEEILEAQTQPPGKKVKAPLPGRRGGKVAEWYVPVMMERLRVGREKAKAAREANALAEAIERQKARGARYHTRAPNRIVDKIMRLMEPGQWYGLKALARSAGMGSSEAARASQLFKKNAWAVRSPNPAWHAAWHGRIRPGATEVEPEWLYRLTEAGEKEKARVAALPRGDSA